MLSRSISLEIRWSKMLETARRDLDPRIRRTRQLLHSALEKLLEEKDFDKISVQDIADRATVNRVTFYDHYPDKFALLQCVVGSRFEEIISARGVSFDGTCAFSMRAIVAAVCDYLAETAKLGCERLRQLGPHVESAVIDVIRKLLLDGFSRHGAPGAVPPELLATAMSWSIYGAAQEWVGMSNRPSSDEIVAIIMSLLAP
jgi:AcrR family transcriptional regulator